MILDYPRDTSQFIVAGPKTLRLASRKTLSSLHDTPYINFGGNRQNIEKKMRRIWIADEGYLLVHMDQSGAEALIVAMLCKDGNYRKLFKHNIKPHSYVALHIFSEQWKKHFNPNHIDLAINTDIENLAKLPFYKELFKLIKSSDDWPAQERYYYIGKKVRHARSYGMRENKYIMSVLEETEGAIAISKKEAERHLAYDSKLFPEITNWQHSIYKIAHEKKELRNLFNYPFKITGYINDDTLRELYAWVPQSTIGTLNNIVFTKMQSYIEENKKNWHLLNNSHDSITSEAPILEVGELIKIKKNYYESIILISPVDGTKFSMQTEVQIGKNWAPYSDKNPDGLKEYVE